MGTRKTRHLYSFAKTRIRNRRRVWRLSRPPTPSARRCSAPCATRRRRRRTLPDVTPLDEERRRSSGTEKRGDSAPRSTATGRARPRRRRKKKKTKTRFFDGARRRVSLRRRFSPPAPTRAAVNLSGAGAGRAWMLKTARRTSVMRLRLFLKNTVTWRRYRRGDRKRCGRREASRASKRGAPRRYRDRDSRRDRARRRLRRRLLPGRVRVPHATLSRSFRYHLRSSVSARHSRSTRSGRPGGAPGARTRRRTRRASPEPGRCRRRAARRKLFLS